MRPEPQQRIHPRALPVWRWTGAFSSLFFWIPPVGYYFLHNQFGMIGWVTWILFSLALLLTILYTFVIPVVRWKRWRYEVQEHELDLKYGVLIVRRTLIPMVRVQHVDTTQGPLMRHYRLSNVTISTAAGTHEIPALSKEVADELRDRISALARVAEDDV
jgi:uncharacterized protein